MLLKGYYIFFSSLDELKKTVHYISGLHNISIGLFLIIHVQILTKDGRKYGLKDKDTYAITTIFYDNKIFNNLLNAGLIHKDNIVLPKEIEDNEWNKEDRLVRARYFEDYPDMLKQ